MKAALEAGMDSCPYKPLEEGQVSSWTWMLHKMNVLDSYLSRNIISHLSVRVTLHSNLSFDFPDGLILPFQPSLHLFIVAQR